MKKKINKDKRFAKKANAIYHYLGIKTKVINCSELKKLPLACIKYANGNFFAF